jgi:hypothetical protein
MQYVYNCGRGIFCFKTAYIFGALIATTLQGLFLVLIGRSPFTATYIHLVESTVTLHTQHLATQWTVAWMARLTARVYTTFWSWLRTT